TQHVYVSSSTKSEDGTQETIVISYNADDTTTTGLGLRIHFDSSVLSASEVTALMNTDLLIDATANSDDDNHDGDASTDQYIQFGWASIFGNWPGSVPTDLASITFDIAEGATGSSAINLTASSNAAGFTFDGQSHQIVITGEEATVESQLSIDSSTGVVTISDDPDFETLNQYSFSVTATDAAGNASQAQSVTLDINNLDEVAPTITSGDTAEAIDENSGVGQVIYTAAADDTEDLSGGFTFSLSEESDDRLSIDSSTGAVTLSVNPDHEVKSEYTFSVIATDAEGNESDAQSVTININDLDEVAPTITSTDTAAAIVENSGAGQVIYTATADDSVDFSEGVIFSLADEDLGFDIDVDTGEVTTNADFVANFEEATSQSFTVLATDAAGNLSAVQAVTLEINNLDEVAPEIISVDDPEVLEGILADEVVYRALADDSADVSAGVTFSLSEDSDTALSINAETGEVTLTDFAVKPSYSFTVIADDGVRQSQKAVTLAVVEQDLEDPVFISSTSVTVDENIGENQVIYTAITDDVSVVNYSLSEDSDAALSIDSSTGAVTLATDPDHEVQSEYSFTVIATDIANNFSQQTVTVGINDLDDAAPTVTSGATSAEVDENSGANQVIYTAIADDSGDDVARTPITYSLANGSDAGLSIDSATGAVSLLVNPNYETKSQYSFAVIATDAVGNSSDAKSVTLDINNLDEVAPTVTSASTAVDIIENSGSNQVIYTATADDAADASDGVTFSLSEDSDVALSIDSATGAVTLATNPDHETQSQYIFTVIATDAANNISQQAVTVSINDIDDADPVITSSDTATAIDENLGAGQVVYTATADDSADISGGVTFSLSEDSDAALSIDLATGAVTLSDDPDAETQSQYTFTVVAADAAGNSSEQAVALDINNLDEVSPTITSGATAATIDENSGAGQVVYTATADDSADISGGVTFSLSEDNDAALSIDAVTGEVTLANNPNFEGQNQYTFSVIATDAADNASDAQLVTLEINNLDEVAPIITSDDTASAIDEDSGAGQVIYTATADDSADVSDGVSFRLAEGSDSALSIDLVTGKVTLATDPVYYYQNEYEFSVLSEDAAGNISSLQPVTLQINEIFPPEASISLETDTGVSADNISSVVKILVSNIKLGATWEYSLDSGITWTAGDNGAPRADDNKVLSFDIDVDGSYEVNVRQTNTAGTKAMSEFVPFTLDTLPPIVEFVSADSEAGTISVNYNESLDPAFSPNTSDYDITQNGNSLTITDVNVSNNVLVLSVTESFNPGALNFTYSASTDASEQVTDLAGNKLDQGFTQMIVSDGYIRGAQVYVDKNGDGIADEDELREEVTSDAFGQIILSDEFLNASENTDENGNPYSVIVKGGVNTDSGAPNEIELTAPVGYSVINPLSTLVSEIASSDVFSGLTLEEAAVAAETSLAVSLGIEVGVGGLGSYDPQSDDNVANRVIATQIATVLAVASSTESTGSEGAETAALSSLANTITSAVGSVTLDSATINSVLSDVIEDTDALDKISIAVDEMEALKASDDVESAFAAIVKAQAKAIDSIAPEAPESSLSPQSDTGVLGDEMTMQDSPTFRVSFETQLLDGTAAVAGDKLEIYSNGVVNGSYVLTEEDISLGYKDHEISVLVDGEHYISAKLTDIAGNQSYVITNIIEVDTVKPEITSADFATNIDENSGADQVIYTATADNLSYANGQVTFSLSEDSDLALSIDAMTGAVTLSDDPNFEDQNQYTFTVIATDAAGNASDAQLLTLNINNFDDTAPEITSGETAEAVDENSGAGQIVYTATADDSADVSNGVTFSLEDETLGFSIDAISGEVTTNANLDANFEGSPSQSFTVVATDAAGNVSDAQLVTLDINNLDEVAPIITSGDTAIVIDENSGAGQVIYTATADDSADISGGITFSLSEDSDEALSIDLTTGAVTLSDDPNFEGQNQYTFSVIATDAAGNASDAQLVTLDINNLDDTAPEITSDATATAINENSGAGQVIYTATADDSVDISDGVTFSLSEGSEGVLSIDSVTGAVTLADNPDYEIQSDYSFTLIATDAAGNESQQNVTLNVNNLDDTAAVITSGDTADTIDENSGTGQVIYTATADDSADVSDGLTFSLADEGLGFSIDAISGEVTTNTDFAADFEDSQSQSFTVVATDAAGNESDAQLVTLDINNLDEVAPIITSGDTAPSIEENSGAGKVIYTAVADDSADISDGVTFTLSDDSDSALSINSATGTVTLSEDPDADTKSQYTFTILATDAAGNASEPKTVTLDISPIDDTSPIITSDLDVSLFDSSSSVIYQVTASDIDSPDETITYSFSPQSVYQDPALPAGAFEQVYSVNSDGSYTMQIIINEANLANYSEGLGSFEFDLNYSELEVSINGFGIPDGFTALANPIGPGVIEIGAFYADAFSVFDVSAVNGLVAEINFDLKEDAYSAQFEITNAELNEDLVANDSVSRYLGNDGLSFNEATGEVSLPNAPDALAQPVYSFTITATDAAGNITSELVTVLIDGAPVITSTDQPDGIDENSGSGQVVYTAISNKPDITTFALSDDSDAGLLIDASTGVVTLAADPDFETQEQYSFTVIATDDEDRSSSKVVIVVVNNLDEVAATFSEPTVTEAIDENIGGGQVVFTASADDSVDVSNGVTYSLSDVHLDGVPTSDLSFNAATGEVTLASNPDHESGEQYTFIVGASDGINTPVALQTVTLDVNDLDENAPIITSSDSAGSISENSSAGQVIYTATADDSADISDGVTFSLSEDSDDALSIDASTGAVTLASDTDYEAQSQYSFSVIATDAAGNVSEPQSVTLDINNLDDTAPVITSADTADAIDENSGASQVVYTAVADDSLDTSAGVSFSLSTDSNSALSIDSATGAVTLNTDPDADTQSQYSFAVVATDAAGNASEVQPVTLDINNLDEAAPIITSAAETVVVDTDETNPVIYTVTADDSADISGGVT
ncbi:cadherin repeat domain-containing protein, partial [Porticoccaceae bacterium]|nr:cadherin repeat domain-containing protein [Porticoccaceae bacterium]